MTRLRIAIVAAGLCTLSVSAGAFEVFDPINTFEHRLLNQWRELIVRVLTQQLARVEQMAQRLSEVTTLAKYAAPDPPRWRTRRIDAALEASDAFMAALNGGDADGRGYAAIARARVSVGSAFAAFGEDDGAAANALRAALATIEIADGVIIAGTDQTGRIRGNRRSEVNTIDALENDVVDPNREQSTTAVLEKLSGAALIGTRQRQARAELLVGIVEQLLVDSKGARDTEAAAMNMQLATWRDGRSANDAFVTGAGNALRTWRQP